MDETLSRHVGSGRPGEGLPGVLPEAGLAAARLLGFVDSAATAGASGAIRVETVAAGDYAGAHQAFASLAARAEWANPFMSPAAVAGHLEGPFAASIVVLTARTQDGELVGAWVLRRRRGAWTLGAEVLETPVDPLFEPNSEPVLDRRRADAVLAAFLGHIRAAPGLPRVVVAPAWPRDRALPSGAEVRLATAECWTRAMLAPAAAIDGEGYLAARLGKTLRRRLKARRQLEENGGLAHACLRGAAAIDGFERYMRLEAAGWKGRAGTAMLDEPVLADRLRRWIAALARRDAVAVDVLCLDGRDIAIGVLIEAGDACLFWKTSFDETLARLSPGVLLDVDVTRRLLARTPAMRMDSGMQEFTDPDTQLWAERRDFARTIIATGCDAGTSLAMLGDRLRQRVRAMARAWRARRGG